MKKLIGIADTMFASVDMYSIVVKTIKDFGASVNIERYTVPGVKDLPVAAKKLIDEYNCNIVLALGMPGREPIDKQCAHQASQGIILAQLLTNTHIIEIFVYLDEGKDDKQLYQIIKNRTREHTINALHLLEGKEKLSVNAGKGIRQGSPNVGSLK